MILILRMAKLLSLGGFFQRLIWALRAACCLLTVFFLFSAVVGFGFLSIIGLIKKPDGDHLRHPAFEFKILFLLSSLGSSLFSV